METKHNRHGTSAHTNVLLAICHTHTHTHTQVRTHTGTHIHTQVCTQSYAYTHRENIRARARTHTRTHTPQTGTQYPTEKTSATVEVNTLHHFIPHVVRTNDENNFDSTTVTDKDDS